MLLRDEALYVSARVAAASLRPLNLLFLANMVAGDGLSLYALFLLIVGIGMLLCGADPHRKYYDRYFRGSSTAALPFTDYLAKLIILVLFGATAIIIVGFTYDAPFWLIGFCVAYFSIEKAFDEVLRFYLFEQNFRRWSEVIIQRVFANHLVTVLFGILHFAFDMRVHLPIFLLFSMFASTASLYFAWNGVGIMPSITRHHSKVIIYRLKRSFRSGPQMLWDMVRVSTLGSVNQLDRVVGGLVDSSALPSLTLLNMCFGFIQQFVDMFYTSRVRRELLRGEIKLRAAACSSSLWLSLLTGCAAGLIALYISNLVTSEKIYYAAEYIIIYLMLHTMIAITSIFQQIVYWNSGIGTCFSFELLFVSTLLLFFGSTSGDLTWYLYGFLAAVGTRGLLYALQVGRQERWSQIGSV